VQGQRGPRVELQFVPAQEQGEYEGLLTILRGRGFEPSMARVPKWGSSEAPHALIVWTITRLPHGVAAILAEVAAAWFQQRAAEEGRPAPPGAIQVMDPLSGQVLAKVRMIRHESPAPGWVERVRLRSGLRRRRPIALHSHGHHSPSG
jgi:hypothetical protein